MIYMLADKTNCKIRTVELELGERKKVQMRRKGLRKTKINYNRNISPVEKSIEEIPDQNTCTAEFSSRKKITKSSLALQEPKQ